MEQDLQLMKHLCMSYNKYIIKRKKLSDACSKANNNNIMLRTKLMDFIRMHPDHELRRQTQARDVSTNMVHREMHNSKIEDLREPAVITYNQRLEYTKIRVSELESRTATHNAKMEEEKSKTIENKANKIQKAREYNIARIAEQKSRRDEIRLERANKKNSANQS